IRPRHLIVGPYWAARRRATRSTFQSDANAGPRASHRRSDLMIQRRIDVNADKLRWIQLGLALGLIAVLGLAYWSVAPFQAEVNHALAVAKSGDLEELKLYIQSYANRAPLASLRLMVGQALAAPVPSFTIPFANGLLSGVVWAWLL